MASLFEIVLGVSGLIGLLLRYIGPLAIAPTITLVGLALFDAAASFASRNWYIALAYVPFSFFFLFLFYLLCHMTHEILKYRMFNLSLLSTDCELLHSMNLSHTTVAVRNRNLQRSLSDFPYSSTVKENYSNMLETFCSEKANALIFSKIVNFK